jgi:hypothetical protein
MSHEPITNNRIVAGAAKEAGYGKAAKEEPAAGTGKATQAVAPFRNSGHGNNDTKGKPSDIKPTPVTLNSVSVVRPKHIDQYAHLLPESTQKKAATVQGLLRDLDVARENMRLLMNDPKAKSDSRAQWARTAATLDAKVKAIYRELDAEWEKLVASGRVTVDDFGNAHVIPAAEATGTVTKDADAEAEPGTSNLTTETKQQIKSLRSWLRDTRGPKKPGEKRDAYVARWKEKYKEMVMLGGKEAVTEAVAKAADLYGIQLDEL